MKVAIYTIALNEEQFVERWYEAHKDADVLLIADTGSTDGTVEKALELGITVIPISIKPWRFDDARNASLALVPADVDVCMAIDMDEVCAEGWREDLEAHYDPEVHTRARTMFAWSHLEDGSNGITYWGEKIHARQGFRWKNPVHEVLVPDRTSETWVNLGFEVHHWPDDSKPRSQYYPLLALSIEEDPDDPRNAHYYARELMYQGSHEEAIVQHKRFLALPGATWNTERCASMRFMGRSYEALGNDTEALSWYRRAVAEAPETREPWVELAMMYHKLGDWNNCYSTALSALAIENRPDVYICEATAWGEVPHDLAAIASYRLGMPSVAVMHGENALKHAPENERLKTNLKWYRDKVQADQPAKGK